MHKFEHIMLIVLLTICVNPYLSFSGELGEELVSTCSRQRDFEDKVICITNIVIETKDKQVMAYAFRSLIFEWRIRDGAMTYVLSNRFLDLVQNNPNFFFEEMVGYTTEFDQWLDKLYLSFVWHLEPPSPLPMKKEALIKFISTHPQVNKEAECLRLKLLSKLEAITPRQID